MESKNRFNTRYITNVEDARRSLEALLGKNEKGALEKSVYDLSSSLNIPILEMHVREFPKILQRYRFDQLISAEFEIKGMESVDIRRLGYMTSILSLASFGGGLIDENNKLIPLPNIKGNNACFGMIQYLTNFISLDDYFDVLYLMVFTAVGKEYYDVINSKIQHGELRAENLEIIYSDPDLEVHRNLMLAFSMIRMFLESIYVYFDLESHYAEN
ncbi:hypothetical protein [Chryseobacterium sp. A301]